jgi:hypothetical protein
VRVFRGIDGIFHANFPSSFSSNTGTMFNVYNAIMSSLTFWTLSILVIVTALIPDLVIKAIQLLDIRIKIFKKRGKRKESKHMETSAL